jgi:6-phosphofructokinase 2
MKEEEVLYTVTVNPTIDVTNELMPQDQLTPEESKTYRPADQLRHAGGKGIDVARVIRNLGGRSIAMGFLGGFTGELVEGLLLQDGLELDFVVIKDETRTNVIIVAHDLKKKHSTLDYRFNSPGPKVQPYEFLELCKKIRSLAKAPKERMPTYAAICGSLCKDMKATSYVALVHYFKEMGATVALDTSGSAMKETLRYAPRPDIIKPNSDEFFELMDSKLPPDEVTATGCGVGYRDEPLDQTLFWREFMRTVVKFRKVYPDMNALITLGKGGMVLLYCGNMFHARLSKEKQRKLNVRSTVGAGDTALAGFLFELDRGRSWEDGLRTAVAAASAAVELRGTESPTKEAVDALSQHVTIHRHESSLGHEAFEPEDTSPPPEPEDRRDGRKQVRANMRRGRKQE